ncbi:hypothetical protein V1525DRAFT_388099 [Lipomyces kononenkoae]|uniref:Uncharacterized protein n=1 Tax=Lipomyces kononenkoae TaxID=34357 RepID=A0ACC3T3B3_LIPKO
MEAIEARLDKLEHVLGLEGTPTVKLPDISVIDHLVLLFRSVESLVQEHTVLQKYLILDPCDFEDKQNIVITDDESTSHKSTIVLAHSNEIAYLSAALPTIASLTDSTLDSQQTWIPSAARSSDIGGLHRRMDAIERDVATLLVRSVALFERLVALSVAGANQAWAEIEDRLGATDTNIRRVELSLVQRHQ